MYSKQRYKICICSVIILVKSWMLRIPLETLIGFNRNWLLLSDIFICYISQVSY